LIIWQVNERPTFNGPGAENEVHHIQVLDHTELTAHDISFTNRYRKG
jgi:hypothetical protein